MRYPRRQDLLTVALVGAIGLTGCVHLGSKKVAVDRFDYSTAIAYAAVRYRDHWFWVNNDDWQSKRALTAIMFFFTLVETGSPEKLPVITIPAQ